MARGIRETTNLKSIWESLGTFWGQFPDKDVITKLWEIYWEMNNELFRRKVRIHLSKYLKTIPPILTYTNLSYKPIFSTSSKNVITLSGLESLAIDNYIFSIPILSGIETGQILVEGTDYEIYDKRYIRFLKTPQFDPRNTGIVDEITLYADNVYRHNPIL
jgi:hypothetical protein